MGDEDTEMSKAKNHQENSEGLYKTHRKLNRSNTEKDYEAMGQVIADACNFVVRTKRSVRGTGSKPEKGGPEKDREHKKRERANQSFHVPQCGIDNAEPRLFQEH